MKRSSDFILALVGLLLFSPFFFLLAILIKLDSKGPVFYKQCRVGKNNHDFTILKFRTMKMESEQLGLLTIGEDPRVTKIGRWMRALKIDEMPQLINVLKGDMSMVGPRPEVRKYVSLYSDRQKKVLEVRPGLTDLASLHYINENEILAQSNNPEKTYIEEIMPHKLELNIEYIDNHSFVLDLKIIFKTIQKILKRKKKK